MVTINGKETKALMYAFDGCHKFYLINTEKDYNELKSYGYDFFPITNIDKDFWNSCPLRFIENATTYEKYVEQCESVVEMDINGRKVVMDFQNDVITVNGEQVA